MDIQIIYLFKNMYFLFLYFSYVLYFLKDKLIIYFVKRKIRPCIYLYCAIFWTKITYKGGSSSDWAPLWDPPIVCDICTT